MSSLHSGSGVVAELGESQAAGVDAVAAAGAVTVAAAGVAVADDLAPTSCQRSLGCEVDYCSVHMTYSQD